MPFKKIIIVTLCVLGSIGALIGVGIYIALTDNDPFLDSYEQHCASCHGINLEGTANGPELMGPMEHGTTVSALFHEISQGVPEAGMPAYRDLLQPTEIKGIAIYIAERRVDQRFTAMQVDAPLDIPASPISSETHDFRIEVVTDGLHAKTYSVAPLPDGDFLVTEKLFGLRKVTADGTVSELIEGAPTGFGEGIELYGLDAGVGHIMEVALHPDYADNGWVYMHYGHRCEDCNDAARESVMPVSMNRVIRGRIRDGRWVDEEVIWEADPWFYSSMVDTAAGGRLAFDGDGYLFMSIGLKGLSNFKGPQDMGSPYGKILRLHDDGRVPNDNPFVGQADALPEIWTYGHRSPQGLEYDRRTHTLWGTEHGPRGGDEVNLLQPGRNYGWPLYSKGMDYDLTDVEYGKNLNLEFDIDEIEQPAYDLTPSPAVSNLMIYEGSQFPNWQHNLFVGSLKARDLFRLVVENGRIVHAETVITDLARIRDVESGPDGCIYLLLENAAGGMLVRLVPAEADLEGSGTLLTNSRPN